MPKVKLYNAEGKQVGEKDLKPEVFGVPVNENLVHEVMVSLMGNARQPLAHTKTKGEVRGGGKKPWKQKHTGRARQGSTRNPHWPGGGVSFGPKPRKYTRDLNRGMRTIALSSALAGKARQGAVAVLAQLNLPGAKTSEAAALLKKVSPAGSVLMITAAADGAARRAFRNLERARIEPAASVSTYDILKAGRVVVVADALPALAARCGGN